MSKRCLHSANGPAAAGPYSHAVVAGGLLFVSGQGPLKPDGSGLANESFDQEVRQTLDNVKTVLEDCGASLQDVVKVTVYLSDMNRFADLNEIYKEYFPDHPPARTCIQAGRLPLDFAVEVDVIAALPG